MKINCFITTVFCLTTTFVQAQVTQMNGSVALYDGFYYKIVSNQGVAWPNTNLIGHGYASQDYTSITVPGSVVNTGEIRLLANGFTGIGTPTPTEKLSVTNGAIKVDGGNNGYTFIANSNNSNLQVFHPSSGGVRLFNSSGNINLAVNATGSVTGNVGVGVTNPGNRIEVNGSVAVYDGSYYKIISNNGSAWSNTNIIGHGYASNQDYTSLQVPGSASNGAELRLWSNGNVSIGTSNPNEYKLAVNGAAVFTRAVVKNYASWPDYVFDSAYALKPLNEVDDFIKLNKRLPGIPAAKEIESAGLDVGELIKKQQEKIEELTLYLINQEKRMAKQQDINAQLLERIEQLEKKSK